MHKISAQSKAIVKSYRVNGRTAGRTDTLTDSIVYSLFEYTKIKKEYYYKIKERKKVGRIAQNNSID